jgi:hypothetical protein
MTRLVLTDRDRLQYRAFLLFYSQMAEKHCEDGSLNPNFVADTASRLAIAAFKSRDEVYEKTLARRPELIERFEREFSHGRPERSYKNRRAFVGQIKI